MKFSIRQFALALAAGGVSPVTSAQPAAAAPEAVTGPLSSVILGMVLVLAVIAAVAWLMKRLAPRTYGNSSALRVVAGAAVGQRERVVIVEIGAVWLVVGVAPGCVNVLHQMPRTADGEAARAPLDAQSSFAQWLRQFMEKRGER
jgi:flagellar protein FliO/FliZ